MGLEGGVLSRMLFLIASRVSQAQEQFWEICLGGGGGQLPRIFEWRALGEGSYRRLFGREFGEARLGEGSHRRFFGREIAEPAACEGSLAKKKRVWNSTGNPPKKVPKSFKNGTLEAPGSCLLYTSPSPRDKRQSRMPSSA